MDQSLIDIPFYVNKSRVNQVPLFTEEHSNIINCSPSNVESVPEVIEFYKLRNLERVNLLNGFTSGKCLTIGPISDPVN